MCTLTFHANFVVLPWVSFPFVVVHTLELVCWALSPISINLKLITTLISRNMEAQEISNCENHSDLIAALNHHLKG